MTRIDGAAQRPIVEVAHDLDIAEEFLDPYGRGKAKIRLEAIAASGRKPGKLILVSAISDGDLADPSTKSQTVALPAVSMLQVVLKQRVRRCIWSA